MWYDGTYACGHDGRMSVTGRGKDHNWIVERHFEGLCPECLKQKRVIEAEQNKQDAKEQGWPDLTGSEKQIAWALKIRKSTIKEMKEKGCKEAALIWITKKTSAKFWIETARYGLHEVNKAYQKDMQAISAKQEEREMTDAKILEPEEKTHPAVVEVVIKNSQICLYYMKDDTFKELVKGKGYIWTGCWSKKINEFSGPAKDRAAEIANVLLNEGFSVEVPGEIVDAAVNGTFEDEQMHWIKYDAQIKRFVVSWYGRDDDL